MKEEEDVSLLYYRPLNMDQLDEPSPTPVNDATGDDSSDESSTEDAPVEESLSSWYQSSEVWTR